MMEKIDFLRQLQLMSVSIFYQFSLYTIFMKVILEIECT